MKTGIISCIDKAPDDAGGVSCYRMLTFAQHESTEGKPDPSLIKRLSRIGEVTVNLWRCRETGALSESNQSFKALGENGIPEKALKGRAVSCHAKLGRVETASEVGPYTVVSYESRPMAKYTFRYRSRRDLEIEGIIKSRPLLPIEDQDPDDLTPEEARELVRRMRAEKEKTAKIKPELKVKPENRAPKRQHSEVVDDEDGDGDDDEISITGVVALNTKRARTAGPASVEVLDLTGE